MKDQTGSCPGELESLRSNKCREEEKSELKNGMKICKSKTDFP